MVHRTPYSYFAYTGIKHCLAVPRLPCSGWDHRADRVKTNAEPKLAEGEQAQTRKMERRPEIDDPPLAKSGSCVYSFSWGPNTFTSAEHHRSGLPRYILFGSMWMLYVDLVCVCMFADALEAALVFLSLLLCSLFFFFPFNSASLPAPSFLLFCEECFSHCLSCDCNDPMFHFTLLQLEYGTCRLCLFLEPSFFSLFTALTIPYCEAL